MMNNETTTKGNEMATLITKWGSDKISVSANWAEASSQIMGDLEGGLQVADVRHDPRTALRKALEQCARHEGLDSDDDDVIEQIDAAMSFAAWED